MDCQRLAIVFCGTGEHGLGEVDHVVGVVALVLTEGFQQAFFLGNLIPQGVLLMNDIYKFRRGLVGPE